MYPQGFRPQWRPTGRRGRLHRAALRVCAHDCELGKLGWHRGASSPISTSENAEQLPRRAFHGIATPAILAGVSEPEIPSAPIWPPYLADLLDFRRPFLVPGPQVPPGTVEEKTKEEKHGEQCVLGHRLEERAARDGQQNDHRNERNSPVDDVGRDAMVLL